MYLFVHYKLLFSINKKKKRNKNLFFNNDNSILYYRRFQIIQKPILYDPDFLSLNKNELEFHLDLIRVLFLSVL